MDQLPIPAHLHLWPWPPGSVWVPEFSLETGNSLCDTKTCYKTDTRLQNPKGYTDDPPCFKPWGKKGLVWCVFSFPPSNPLLNYSNTVDCAAIICQEPKSTSLFLCVKTDEAGEEDGKLRHQRWHSEYLMVFMGTATDQSQKHCTPGWKAKNTSLAKKG